MKTVLVVFGGISSEHEVSLRSAASVLNNLDRNRYRVETLGIAKDGHWLRYTGPVERIEDGSWFARGPVCPAILSPDRSHKGIVAFAPGGVEVIPVDVAFPVLHGKYGEDGTIQGLFALAGIPYVGSGALGSSVCMDKEVSHRLLVAAGVPKTKLVSLRREDVGDMEGLADRLGQQLGFPMFVKPANAGSSVGISKVKKAEDLPAALELAFESDRKVVAEQEIRGREVECAVLGNEFPQAAQVLAEIEPKHEFYDYEGKYLDDSTTLHIPADLERSVAEAVRELAVKAYRAVECRGLARVDFFVREDGSPVLNEINTLPGFTSISMYPRMFEASGTPYPELLDKLLELALQEAQETAAFR